VFEPDLGQVTTGDYFVFMRTVGVKELKSRLSEYLRAVKRGEVVIVTERDQPIAELRRPVQRPAGVEDHDAALDALAATGEVTRSRPRRKGWRWTTRGLGMKPGSASRILDELRAESQR
jgi:antitoxin (DNA-binding transcriptional repressor) of toxin-antitoxin stability system